MAVVRLASGRHAFFSTAATPRPDDGCPVLSSQLVALKGHRGAVVAADWLGRGQVATACWDRIARVFDVETGTLIDSFKGLPPRVPLDSLDSGRCALDTLSATRSLVGRVLVTTVSSQTGEAGK